MFPPLLPPLPRDSIAGELNIISSILLPPLLRLMPLTFPRDSVAGEIDAALYIIGIAVAFESDLALLIVLIGLAHAIL